MEFQKTYVLFFERYNLMMYPLIFEILNSMRY